MKAYTESYFILQEVLSQVIAEAAGSRANAIRLTDDFIAPQCLAGSSQPLTSLLRPLLSNLLASADPVQVKVRPLLQTGSNVLLEFSVAHRKEPGVSPYKACPVDVPPFIAEAESAIKDLGGRSERIQLSNAGGGLKFILKWAWLPQGPQPANESSHSFRGRRVLIAEDNEVNARGLIDLLSKFGTEVDLASDGNGAIDLLTRKGTYDLVLMDLHMPHMNGLEAARFIRKKLKKDLPIIGLSTTPSSEEEATYKVSGLSHCIPKSSASAALPSLLSHFIGPPKGITCMQKTRRTLAQWSEHRGAETHKHAALVHQHRPAL